MSPQSAVSTLRRGRWQWGPCYPPFVLAIHRSHWDVVLGCRPRQTPGTAYSQLTRPVVLREYQAMWKIHRSSSLDSHSPLHDLDVDHSHWDVVPWPLTGRHVQSSIAGVFIKVIKDRSAPQAKLSFSPSRLPGSNSRFTSLPSSELMLHEIINTMRQ